MLPPPLQAFFDAHPTGTSRWFVGKLPIFEGDEHELVVDPGAIVDPELAGGDELDLDRYLVLGAVGQTPVLVDRARATLPVVLLADGELHVATRSLSTFARRLATAPRPAPRRATIAGELEPVTVVEPEAPNWPRAPWLLWQWRRASTADFLWVDPGTLRPRDRARKPAGPERLSALWIPPPKPDAALLRGLYYDCMRKGLPAARAWVPAFAKLHRGTSRFTDLAHLDWLPVVTPRVRRLLERFALPQVELLALRIDIAGEQGDYFILNPTAIVDCIDVEASRFPREPDGIRYPAHLTLDEARIPPDAHLFRLNGLESTIVASAALVDSLRDERLSCLHFALPAQWSYDNHLR